MGPTVDKHYSTEVTFVIGTLRLGSDKTGLSYPTDMTETDNRLEVA